MHKKWVAPYLFSKLLNAITERDLEPARDGSLFYKTDTLLDQFHILSRLIAADAIMASAVLSPITTKDATAPLTGYKIHLVDPYRLKIFCVDLMEWPKVGERLTQAKPFIEKETGSTWTLRQDIGLVAKNPEYADVLKDREINAFFSGLESFSSRGLIELSTPINAPLIVISWASKHIPTGASLPQPYQPTRRAELYTPVVFGRIPVRLLKGREHTLTLGISS